MSATISHMNTAVKFNKVRYKHNHITQREAVLILSGSRRAETCDQEHCPQPTTTACAVKIHVQWLQNGDLHGACHNSVPLWNSLILLEYTGLSWLVELYFLMLVSVRLLMNVWKFGRTLGQAFLRLPSDTGEEHLLMSGCPTYFADTAIPFFQFNSNSNSVIFNSISNSNSTTHKKFQFQFQFQRFQFQFQFRRFQILAISILEMTFDVFFEIDYNYTNKLHVYKIIVINTISLISLVKWLWLHGIMMVDAISIT